MLTKAIPRHHRVFPLPRRRMVHLASTPRHTFGAAGGKTHGLLRRVLGAVYEKTSVSFAILVAILVFTIWLGIGYVLGQVYPEYMVTVQPFEISSEIANRNSLSGKSASAIVVDALNEAATHAAQFHGADYYKWDGAAMQPIALRRSIRIPAETSYGIELNGISLDSLIQLYNRRRYQQWIIGGDVLATPAGLVGRIRLNQGDAARFWETAPSEHASPVELVRDAARMMLTGVCPELLGQAYLQQGQYAEAAEVFRAWEVAEPANWRPSYYLSLAYSYRNKAEEAQELAAWSRNIAAHERSSGKAEKRHEAEEPAQIEDAAASELAVRSSVAAVLELPSSEARSGLTRLQQAQAQLTGTFHKDLTNTDYQVQLGRLLNKQAMVEADLEKDYEQAAEHQLQAIESIGKAIGSLPSNGGLYEQRAIFLRDLAGIQKTQGQPSVALRATEEAEVSDYTRALELKPTEASPLWGAIYAQLDLGRVREAIELAKTIMLLLPDSNDARTAYVVALEQAVKESATQAEIELSVKRLIEAKATETQLQTVWYACRKAQDRGNLEILASDANRRFPHNRAFKDRA